MPQYPDEVLQLLIRMEQLSLSGDRALAKQIKRLQKELIFAMVNGPERISSYKQMFKVRAELKKIAAARFKDIEDTIGEYSETAAEAAIRVEQANMASLGANALNTAAEYYGADVVDRAMERNLPGLPQGKQITVGDMIDRMSNGATQVVGNVANKALIEGLSVTQATKELMAAMDITRNQAKAVMRTSMLASLNQARDEVSKNFDVKKEMWLATLDSKTCPYCGGRDGVCDDTGNLPRPPAHPNCRCTILYLAPGISCEQMKEDMERPQRGPDGKSTRHTPYKDYGEWLKTQPEDFQIKILGKERYELLKSGKISFKQMYVNDGSRLTLGQIREKYNIPKPEPKLKFKPKPKVTNPEVRIIPGGNERLIERHQNLVDSLPDNVKKILSDGDQKFVVSKIVSEFDPDLRNVHPRGWGNKTWDYAEGLHRNQTKEILNTTHFKVGSNQLDIVSDQRFDYVFRHETGHALDQALGSVYETDIVKDLYKTAVDNLPDSDRPYLTYFLQSGYAGRQEAVAEAFKHVLEANSEILSISDHIFKDTFGGLISHMEELIK